MVLPPETTSTSLPAATTSLAPPTTTTTAAPVSPPIADASVAIDRYLATNTNFDVDGFVGSWAYPVPKYYRFENASEDFVRERVTEMFAKHSAIEFRRVSEPTMTPTPDGWETSFDYRAEMVPVDGERRCVVNRLTLSFSSEWLISSASERDGTTC